MSERHDPAWWLERVRCGYCRGRLDLPLSLILLHVRATWQYPSAGNVLDGASGEAVGILCNRCFRAGKSPTEAIEFAGEEVVYHPKYALTPMRQAP